ncbi:MAG: discoidin domain-containing protein, partial [Bacteroidales bacterium]|nr:discoidin domain-containing protein [Bacteroidales bacterium]
HENYASTKELALTDGKRGTWSYGDGRWQAILEADFDVIIDLEEVKTIKSITATFLQEYHAWIWLPKEVNIYTSTDNENFNLLTTLTHDLPVDQTGYYLKDFGWEGETQARYIRYEAKIVDRPGAWLFTDEIIVN